MWLAHHFPGLRYRIEELQELTIEDTAVLYQEGERILKGEADERLAHTKAIATAAGMRVG